LGKTLIVDVFESVFVGLTAF